MYKDDGKPHNYIFVVDDSEELTEGLIVCVTPTDYFNKENCLSDWELKWKCPAWMEEAQESMYIIDVDAPGALTTVQDVHNYLISIGMGYDPAFATFLGRPVVGPAVVPSVPQQTTVKAAKLSTEFFKNYIATTLANDPDFAEVMDAYLDQPAEHASMRNPKNWKRLFKKQGTIASLAGIDQPNFTSFVGFALEEVCSFVEQGCCSDYEMMSCGQVYDQAYMSNTSNKIVVREFYWVGCHDQDTTISFVTDETDTRIVAICYHID